MEKAKQAKKIIGNIAFIGATLALGALSFAGVLVITSSLGWAALAFLLAVTIEGAVYKQNIIEAMKKLGNQKLIIEQAIADRELEKLKEHYKENIFIRDYFAEKKYLHDLEENHGKYSGKNEKIAAAEILRVRARLNRLKALFISSIRTAADDDSAEINKPNPRIRLAIRELLKPPVIDPANTAAKKIPEVIKREALDLEVKRKNRNMNLSIIVATGSGIAAGLVTFSTIQTCLMALGIGLGTATIIGAPIIGFAALGYALLMYRTISDMIQNDTLKKWAGEIHEFSHTPKKNAVFYLKILGIAALVTLAVCATIATAGTWWYLAKNGAEAIKFLPKLGSAILSTTTWAMMIIPNLLFNLVNGLKSIKLLPSIIKNGFNNCVDDWNEARSKENLAQFFNPFRILLKIAKGVMFIGHIISTGITSDQIPWLNPLITTGVSAAMEAGVDLHYIAENSHHKTKKKVGALLESNQAQSDEEQENKKATHDHEHSHDHGHSHAHDHEDHQHTHGDIILKGISFALNCLSVAWDFTFGLLGSCFKDKDTRSWKEIEQDSKVKFFGKKTLPTAPVLSEEVIRYDISTELNELANKYEGNGLTAKAKAFSQLQTKVETIEVIPAPQDQTMATDKKPAASSFLTKLQETIEQSDATTACLKTHRNHFQFFKSKLPQSKICLDEILCDQSIARVCNV